MNIDHGQFSEREKEVIALLLQGKSNKQIALALRIAQSTVEYHLKNIYQKLGVGSRTEAVLRLGKTTGKDTPGEVSESTSGAESNQNGSEAQPISISNVPRSRTYWGIGLLVTAVVVIILFYFYDRSTQKTKPTLCAPPDPRFTEASAPAHPTSQAWPDQIFYEVSPYKFYDGDPTNNDPERPSEKGDIAGVRQQMHYLKDLGVTGLLFSPVFRAPYQERIDPILGTNAELEQLIADAHSTGNGPGLNFILDLSFSTTEVDHPWTQNAGYYRVWNSQDIQDNLGCDTECEPHRLPDGTQVDDSPKGYLLPMPVLNHTARMDSGKGTYRDVTDTIFWLVDTFDIDGFRYGTAHFYCATFWPKFMSDFRDRYGETPEFWHIAEGLVWPAAKKSWQIPMEGFINQTSSVGPIQMDGIYDTELSILIIDVFAKGQNPCITDLCARLLKHLRDPQGVEYPERLLASIDHPLLLFLDVAQDKSKKERLYLASVFLLTSNRVPLIKSGNEYGMNYQDPGALFSGSVDQAFHEDFKTLVKIRRDHPAFRRGSLTPLNTSANILSFARQYEDKTFIVVLNIDGNPGPNFEIDLALKGIACNPVRNLLKEDDQTLQPGSAGITVALEAWEAKIIQCE